MSKIGFFIIPGKRNANKIYKYKKKIRDNFGEQIYLNHLPHVTLGVINVKDKLFKDFDLNISKFQNKLINKRIEFYKSYIFKKDLLARNGDTLVYKIKKYKWLEELQIEIFNQLKEYKINCKKKKFKEKWMNSNFAIYGYPFVGNSWIPHITISSILENKQNKKKIQIFEENFLREKVSFDQKVNNITFFQINKNSHKLIKRYKI
jgi:2'-5' RNA ligase